MFTIASTSQVMDCDSNSLIFSQRVSLELKTLFLMDRTPAEWRSGTAFLWRVTVATPNNPAAELQAVPAEHNRIFSSCPQNTCSKPKELKMQKI